MTQYPTTLGRPRRSAVLGEPDEPHQPAAVPGLLEDLPQGAVLVGLPRVELALGQRPVVAVGPMDDGDLVPGRAGDWRSRIPPAARTTSSRTLRGHKTRATARPM